MCGLIKVVPALHRVGSLSDAGATANLQVCHLRAVFSRSQLRLRGPEAQFIMQGCRDMLELLRSRGRRRRGVQGPSPAAFLEAQDAALAAREADAPASNAHRWGCWPDEQLACLHVCRGSSWSLSRTVTVLHQLVNLVELTIGSGHTDRLAEAAHASTGTILFPYLVSQAHSCPWHTL